MGPERLCPDCGSHVPADAPRGLCPACLMGAAFDRASPDGSEATISRAAVGAGVLDTIARTVGPVPRVLLPDTAPGEAPGPVVKPDGHRADASTRYRIDGEIARGGMGSVLKGRDPDLGREVALKVLRDDYRDQPAMVCRFVEEAQIGGQLQHPGIVPIYELGTMADRRPFFAMKLVKGYTLAQLLDQGGDPNNDLPRFLSIFESIGQTMAYAHARGVIHRDLKPSNVMVGSFGEVQVMDWGLAKVLTRGGVADDATAGKMPEETVIATARSGGDGDPDLSHAGSIMGTPSYMAPEQARGEGDRVDERADVFALGSILCELLTGRPAFTGRSSGEIQRQAARGDTADALKRLDACGADADLVALARDCLAAEREDRPRDAHALAERTTAYLSGVQRRLREAERERAVAEAKAVEERKRRRLQVGLAASLLGLTVAGGLGGGYLLQQRAARSAAADRLLGEARTLRDLAANEPEAVPRWEAVLTALDQADALEQAGGDPEARRQLAALRDEAKAGAAAARRDRALLEAAAEVRAGTQDLGLAGADKAYARAFREAGVDIDAAAPAESGARLRARPVSVVVAAAAALDDWALDRYMDRPKDDRWRRPLEVARAADPDPFREEVRAAILEFDKPAGRAALEALAADPETAGLPPASAVLLAAPLGDAGVSLLRATAARHPDDPWVNFALATRLGALTPPPREEQVRYYSAARAVRPETAHNLAHLLDDMGRSDESLAIFADLVARRPDNAHHLACYGISLRDHGRAEASAILERAVAAGRAAIRIRPDDSRAHTTLGDALARHGKLDEAIAEHREAVRLDPDSSVAHNQIGLTYYNNRDHRAAEAAYRRAIELRPDDGQLRTNLGLTLLSLRRLDEAETEYRAAIRLMPSGAVAYEGLGNALKEQGRLDEAIAEYRSSLRLKPDFASGQYNLGIALRALGRTEEAIAAYRETIRIKPDFAEAHTNLANILRDRGEIDLAIGAYREAIRVKPDLMEAHLNLGVALAMQGKRDEAIREHVAAIRLKPDVAEAHYGLGIILSSQGKLDEAMAEYREAIRIQPDHAEAHTNIGTLLSSQGKPGEAEPEYREAIRLKPDLVEAHYSLGTDLFLRGKLDEAMAEYREAIRIQPDHAEAHCNLGMALQQRGDYAGSVAELRTGHELGSKRPGWPYPSAQWVREAERLAAQADRLPAILKGEEGPKDAADLLTFAQMCYETKRYAAAARLWAEALEADPNLADDRAASLCQMLWTGFDSGGVLDLDPIDELRPRDDGLEAGRSVQGSPTL